jgi:hypothetical protein
MIVVAAFSLNVGHPGPGLKSMKIHDFEQGNAVADSERK